MRLPLALPLLLSLLLAPQTFAASFDCKAAKSPRETAVCSTPALSTLDDDVARAYAADRTRLTPAAFLLVQADQREWLPWLDKVCPAGNAAIEWKPCLENNYRDRLDQLTKGVQRINGVPFFTRAHFVYRPGKPPGKDDRNTDPGFGYGQFSWPQVDAPDPDHAAFNAAVYTAAVSVAATANKRSAGFDAAVDANGYVYDSFTLFAVNDRLIDTDFTVSTFEWGAAHPLSGQSSFLWRPDQRRALSGTDILRAGSDWQTRLIEPAMAKLQHDGPDTVWQGDELRKGVADGIKDVSSWDVSTKGLTITFSQYAVAPYASGMPTVTFTWKELAPFINPNLDPTHLPQPLQ